MKELQRNILTGVENMAIIREDNGDAGANSGTQYALSVGDSFQGSLNPVNDNDWLRVELTAETIYDIILNGVYSAQLTILDSQGEQIAYGISNFDYTKIKIFSPDVSGTYYISIGSSNTDHTADYEISLEENPITTVSYDEIADYMINRRPHTQAFDTESGACSDRRYQRPGRSRSTTCPLGAGGLDQRDRY